MYICMYVCRDSCGPWLKICVAICFTFSFSFFFLSSFIFLNSLELSRMGSKLLNFWRDKGVGSEGGAEAGFSGRTNYIYI